MSTMTIPRRFRGPPNSGNGGYVCGNCGPRPRLTEIETANTGGEGALGGGLVRAHSLDPYSVT